MFRTLHDEIPICREISRGVRCVPGSFSWLCVNSSTASIFSSLLAERGLPLPLIRLQSPVASTFLINLFIVSNFQFLSGNYFRILLAPHREPSGLRFNRNCFTNILSSSDITLYGAMVSLTFNNIQPLVNSVIVLLLTVNRVKALLIIRIMKNMKKNPALT